MDKTGSDTIARAAASVCSHASYLGGMPLLLTGIILEYMSIILLHTRGKPTFFVVDRSADKQLLYFFSDTKNADSE
jgi:polyisoprenyl-phosphate glycosyltransferase